MNSESLGEVESSFSKLSRLRGWLSRTTPGIFGVEYATCSPILAGQASGRTDIVGRDIVLSKSPLDAVFYNVAADPQIVSRGKAFELDYILGDSDATDSADRRLPNGTLVYWNALKKDDWISPDDALIVRLDRTHRDASGNDLSKKDIAPDWLCLRRAGKLDGTLFDGDDRLFVRSKKSGTNEIILDLIDLDAVEGRIFSRVDSPLKDRRVSVAAHLPFAPSV